MGEYYGQYGEGLAFYPGERSNPNMARVYYETIDTIGVALQQYANWLKRRAPLCYPIMRS